MRGKKVTARERHLIDLSEQAQTEPCCQRPSSHFLSPTSRQQSSTMSQAQFDKAVEIVGSPSGDVKPTDEEKLAVRRLPTPSFLLSFLLTLASI
jgi:hypothetical protein